jgi:protein involved in polysaccharide export with SLBB domain
MTPIRANSRDTPPGRTRTGPVMALLFVLLACLAPAPLAAPAQAPEGSAGVEDPDAPYRLGPGDTIHVRVFNHDDLSGDFVLDGSGRFSMHLIGQVEATGLTGPELEQLLISKLKPDYLVNPRVSVTVQEHRPYYIMGEVNSIGSYAYVDGMTYLTAIAIAGGYTYRAKKDVVYVVRATDPNRDEVRLDVSERVHPGDIIRVAERIF